MLQTMQILSLEELGRVMVLFQRKKTKRGKNNALQISDGVPTDELPKKMKKDQSSIEKKHSQNVKESQSVKKKKNKKSEKEPGAVIEEMLQVNGQHEETNNLVHLQEKSSSPSDEVNHSVKKKKNEKNNKEPANGSVVEETTCTTAESPKNHVQKDDESFVLDTNFSQSSLMTDSVKKTKNKKKKKGKVSAVDGPTTSEENNKDFTSEKQTAKIEEADPGLKTNTAKGEPHKEETTKEHKETTINISSKKRKTGSSVSNVELTMTPKVKDHGKKSKAVTTPNSFATFENVTPTPPLFVRKAASKVKETPKTEPRKAKLNLVTPDMEAPASEGKKRVSFIMSRNIAQEFKESLKPSPAPAFNPEKLPEQGILKTPPSGGAIYKRTRSAVKAKRAKAADFF
ncbi:ribosomal RNA processing protein 1 homolog B isoform X6 [Lingula anatina]|uniref:Ribosomal RNA processing protein 1 homolog B isoform X6 n=1 Tax=Lingula anatina TaxID=7574 RepID=A0A1S3HYN5_LINAN|nr:ribosomal RNA processing protein 1 homolog B isoform X6 [Lingula anatina]|eukprot:XP_013390194.1 ribosomal RNA processing protein 1 homolog B isoform X6 [Lingula anatina]